MKSQKVKNRKPKKKTTQGFTLMETLVVLILVAIVSSLIFQGLGFINRVYDKTAQITQSQNTNFLSREWFTQVIKGSLISNQTGLDQFIGNQTQIQGHSMQLLHSDYNQLDNYHFKIQTNNTDAYLIYQYLQPPTDNQTSVNQANNPQPIPVNWQLKHWKNQNVWFEYLDNQGQWHTNWNTQQNRSNQNRSNQTNQNQITLPIAIGVFMQPLTAQPPDTPWIIYLPTRHDQQLRERQWDI